MRTSLCFVLAFLLVSGFTTIHAQSGSDCQAKLEQAALELEDEDPQVRADAAMELGGFTRSVDGHWGRLARAIGSADECEDAAREYVPDIAQLLQDQYPVARRSAVASLAALGAREYIPSLAELLEDPDPSVKVAAAHALADLHVTEYAGTHLKSIARLLKDSSPEVRCDVISALAALGATGYVGEIAAQMRDGQPAVREQALLALADLNATTESREIALLLKREDTFWVRSTAIDALGKLGAREYARDIAAFLRSNEEPEVRTSALQALATLGAKNYAPTIVSLLKDRDQGIRGSALRALGDLGAGSYTKEIAELLSDATPYIRGYAAQTLAKLGATDQAKRIAALLVDRDASVRETAVESLKALDYEPPTKDVFKMAADAVVLIEVECANGQLLGTGFLVSADGCVLTNRHVVAPLDKERMGPVEHVTVTMRDGRRIDVARIVTDPHYDVALVQLEQPPKDLTYLYFADRLPEVGEDLVIIGNPGGYGWSLSEGRVSQIRDDSDGSKNIWIQTDGAVNPGNSGGPMLNHYGQAVSIATMGLQRIGDVNVSGMNFGLAISVGKRLLGWR